MLSNWLLCSRSFRGTYTFRCPSGHDGQVVLALLPHLALSPELPRVDFHLYCIVCGSLLQRHQLLGTALVGDEVEGLSGWRSSVVLWGSKSCAGVVLYGGV